VVHVYNTIRRGCLADAGEGNPNHDPSNGQFSSGGGSGSGGGKVTGPQISESHAEKHGISPEVHSHINGILSKLSNSYPAVGGFIKSVEFVPSTTNEFDPFSRELRISKTALGGSVEALNRAHETANKPGFAVSGGAEALLTHEFGHAIDHYIISKADESTKDEWFDEKKKLEKEIGPASEYAKKSTREWLSEQFTAETLGQKPKKLLPVIEKFLEKVG